MLQRLDLRQAPHFRMILARKNSGVMAVHSGIPSSQCCGVVSDVGFRGRCHVCWCEMLRFQFSWHAQGMVPSSARFRDR